ncbi:hypothetical protein HDV05_006012 [Chytridiales sp. JEL 0842]|nr:hypothetical protein HDV05_006012 [Chytridiales sp. JEL 0842]
MVGGGGGGNEGSDFENAPLWHKFLGIGLAVTSALFIGSSFVLKKRGLLDANALDNLKPGEGHGAVLSDIFLKEKLNFSAKIGCAQCVMGSILLVMNIPSGKSTTTMASFWKLVLDPIFQGYLFLNLAVIVFLIFYAAPRWGERWPMVYIAICSLVGAFEVVSIQGLGSSIVYSVSTPSNNQFKDWSIYPLLVFIIIAGVLQIHYLNMALNIFSTAIVTPIYYVCFTTATLFCSAVLFRDFGFASAVGGVSAVIGFLVIVAGVCLLFAYSLKLSKNMEMCDISSTPETQSLHDPSVAPMDIVSPTAASPVVGSPFSRPTSSGLRPMRSTQSFSGYDTSHLSKSRSSWTNNNTHRFSNSNLSLRSSRTPRSPSHETSGMVYVPNTTNPVHKRHSAQRQGGGVGDDDLSILGPFRSLVNPAAGASQQQQQQQAGSQRSLVTKTISASNPPTLLPPFLSKGSMSPPPSASHPLNEPLSPLSADLAGFMDPQHSPPPVAHPSAGFTPQRFLPQVSTNVVSQVVQVVGAPPIARKGSEGSQWALLEDVEGMGERY